MSTRPPPSSPPPPTGTGRKPAAHAPPSRVRDDDAIRDMESRQLRQMLVFAGCAATVALAATVLAQLAFVLLLASLPLIAIHAQSTCPAESTFDAKKEMKRVMRG